jgi:hypothetical protein
MNKNKTFWTLLVLGYIFILFSCKSVSEVTRDISDVKIETIYKDSVRYIDSVIPIERYVDIVKEYDTLTLETSQAKAQCWVDSIFLKGMIENKKVINYKYIDRWNTIINDSIVYKDNIDYIETIKYKPNPINKVTATISVIFILMLLVLILRKFLK